MAKPISLKEKRQNLQQSTFVGRDLHLNAFRENIARDPNEAHFVNFFNIYGQGGVGKTSLLRQLIQMTEQHNAITAYTDEGIKSVPDFMGQVAEQFLKQGHELKEFSKQYKLFRQKKQELESDPERPQDYGEFIGSTIVKSGTKFLKSTVPVALPILELIDTDAFAKQAGAWTSFIINKIKNKDEVQLLLEPENVLTPIWLKEIVDLTNEHKICFFIDTYEEASLILESWLLKLLNIDYYSSGIIMIISGRDKLNPNHWTSFNDLTIPLPVEPFTEKESLDYLRRRGIIDEELTRSIIYLSGGLPVLLATLAETSPSTSQALTDVSQTAVERFLKWVDDSVKRKVALYASLPNRINQDIIAVLIEDDKIEEIYTWLSNMPFFEKRGGYNTYHPVVREQMMRNLRTKSPQTWYDLHNKLDVYFESQQNLMGLEHDAGIKNERWRQFSCEILYHRFCASPDRSTAFVINGFLKYLYENPDYASNWVTFLQNAERDSDYKCTCLTGLEIEQFINFYEKKKYEEVIDSITKLIEYDKIEPDLLPQLYFTRGLAYRESNNFEQSLKDLDKSLEINEKFALKVFVNRGIVFNSLKNHESALNEFNKALKVDEGSALVYIVRALCYSEMKDFENALIDLNKAIEIDGSLPFAYGMRGLTNFQLGNLENALSDFNEQIKTESDSVYYSLRGIVHLMMDSFEEALADFNKEIELVGELPRILVKRGSTLYEMQNYEDALKDFDKAIELEAASSEAYVGRGKVYYEKALYDEALKDLNQAVSFSDDSSEVYLYLGKTYYAMEKYHDALKAFNSALDADEDLDEVYIDRALTYNSMGNYEDAVKDFTRALEINQSESVLLYRGLTYHEMGYYEEALKDFDKALETIENPDEIYSIRGVTYLEMERFEEALEGFNQTLRVDNESVYALINRGITFHEMDSYQNAINDFNSVIKLKGETSFVLIRRGITYLEIESYDEALADFNKAFETDGGSIEIYINRGIVHLEMGSYEDALKDFDEAFNLGEESIELYINRGTVYFEIERYEEALQDFNNVILLSEDLPEAYFQRGRTYYEMKNFEEALKDFNELLEKSESTTVLFHRGLSYYELERFEEALRDFDRIINFFNEESTLVLFRRGITYQKLKLYTDAINDFSKILDLDKGATHIYEIRGLAYYEMEHYEEALDDFNKIVELNDDLTQYSIRGLIHLQMGSYANALKDFSKVLELKGDSPSALSNRGLIYFLMFRYEEALEDFGKAIELSDKPIYEIIQRGSIYHELGDYENALKEFDKSIEIDGESASAYRAKCRTYLYLGRYEDALFNLNEADKFKEEDDSSNHFFRYMIESKLNYPGSGKSLSRAIELSKSLESDAPVINTLNLFNNALYSIAQSKMEEALEYGEKALITANFFQFLTFRRDLEFFLILFAEHVTAKEMYDWIINKSDDFFK